jgi:multidrug efflux pump subunit AcrB
VDSSSCAPSPIHIRRAGAHVDFGWGLQHFAHADGYFASARYSGNQRRLDLRWRAEVEAHPTAAHHPQKKGLFARLHDRFNAGFESFQANYVAALEWVLGHRRTVFALLGGAVILAISLVPFVGRDFFPTVTAEQIRLHVVAPTGMRIEETERVFGQVEDALRRHIPENERTNILDQIGIPSGYNLAITDSANVSASDGEILVTLSDHRSKSTSQYIRDLRKSLSEEFPDLTFYFGLPSPIEIQVSGAKRDASYAIARKIENDLRHAAGAVDVRLFQVQNAPRLHFEVDRARASVVDLTQRDVANNLLLTVASNSQVAPSFWADPATGNSYAVSIRIPENRINTIDDLQTLALQTPRGPQLLEDVAELSVRSTPLFVTHVDIQPTFSVRADVQLSDLGSVARSVDAIVAKYKAELPPGSVIAVRGQVESMYSAFARLALGILAATLLVYALLVVNFQSWRDPFIIITALSGALVGIILGLFVTQTTFSIPSLMGAIMSVGVATANSILVVSFAKEQRELGMSAIDAARAAGRVRLRPVIMTALAMVVGMLPMAIGHGVGSEQNAALGRAVIGGLCGATLATLFIVPLVYSVLTAKDKLHQPEPDLDLQPLQLQGEGA